MPVRELEEQKLQKIGHAFGMELVSPRDFGEKGKLYDLIKYSD